MPTFDEALIRWLDSNDIAQDVNITERLLDNLFSLGVREQGQVDPSGTVLASSVIVSATPVNLYSNTPTEKTKIYGFILTGETDATFTLSVNGSPVAYDQITGTRPVAVQRFARPMPVSVGQAILLTVVNQGLKTSDFKGILMLEEVDE